MSTGIAVVICAYTELRWDDIRRAVDSVRTGSVVPDELVLVIDHNPTLLERARHELSGVRVIPNVHVQGLSGARNTGIHATTAEIIAFLDDDAAGRKDWLKELVAPFADPDVAVVGGRSIPVWAGAHAPKMLPAELYWIVGSSYRGLPTKLSDVRNVMGCSMAFARTAIRGLGGFNTGVGRIGTLPMGCEETELCIRITQSDSRWRILLNPASVVDHRVSADRESWRYLVRRSYAEGLSKAAISQLIGRDSALETERAYTTRVLPKAVANAVARGQLRAATGIIVSVFCAALGYTLGRLRSQPIAPSTSLTLCSVKDDQAA